MTGEMKVKVKYYVGYHGMPYAHVWIDQAPGTRELFRVDPDNDEIIEIIAPYDEGYDPEEPTINFAGNVYGDTWADVIARVHTVIAGLQAIAQHYEVLEDTKPANQEFVITAESVVEKPLHDA